MSEATRVLRESGFRVSFPAQTSFRMADCSGYQRLSGLHLKEMDIGWLDKDCLWLLELKGKEVWDHSNPQAPSQQLLDNLTKKATDMLLILSAVWSGSEAGKEIAQDLPSAVVSGIKKLKVIFLLDTPPDMIPLLGPLKDKLNQLLGGRMRLFGLKHISLIHWESAIARGLPVERDE